jgi:hypothetical protein
MRREPPLRGRAGTRLHSQSGAGMLGVIALLGVSFAMVQGTLFYKSRTSAAFLAAEKNKILAQQAAEAGVEENIADLGTRKLKPYAGMYDYPTYVGRAVGKGTFSTSLTTLAQGIDADTVELLSKGKVAAYDQTVRARLQVKRFSDTTLTPVMLIDIDTTITSVSVSRPETTFTTVVQDPMAMPALDATPAYDACMASSARRCDVCHIPPGDIPNRHVITINKNAIHTHIGHHGDYVTTDGTCDIYNPREERSIGFVNVTVQVTLIVDNTVYDTVVVIDTLARVQVLSWK